MIAAYREGDFLALFELVNRAVEEVPEWGFLPLAIVSQPDRFLLWKADDNIVGFLYVLGAPIYSIAALYILPKHRQFSDTFLRQAVERWKEEAGAIAILVPEALGSWQVDLSDGGFERLARLESIQALEKVTWLPIELPEGFRIVPWQECYADQVAELLSKESRGTREGLFLCFPDPATEKTCQQLLVRLTSGEMGPFLKDASGILLAGNRVAGVVLMFSPSEGDAMLWELAIAKEHQSRGLAPPLISHLQWGTRTAGLCRIRFAYCERNRAIRRLFEAPTIVSEQRETLWLWQSAEYLSQRHLQP